MSSSNYSISVVVLTKNSAKTINKCLESIFRQTKKPDEVIVVDGSSNDGTIDIVKQFPVKLVVEPGLGYGYARNLGVREAKGDIIFFIDSDCYAEPDWIENILPHFNNPEIAGVTGCLRLWNVEDACARFLAYVGGRINMPKTQKFVEIAPTMNLALRRSVILEMGGFDEKLIRCEDTDITYKITRKYKILYEPSAVVWFKGSPNFWVASRKCLRHFIGVGQLFAKHGFNRKFVRFNLILRGLILMVAIIMFAHYLAISAILLAALFAEFILRVINMYLKCRDRCVTYYVVFFTFWSLISLAIFYGLYLGLKDKRGVK